MWPDPDAILDALGDEGIAAILQTWSTFTGCTAALLKCRGGAPSVGPDFAPAVATLCNYALAAPLQDHFLLALEETFKSNAVNKFWRHFDDYCLDPALEVAEEWPHEELSTALEEICIQKNYQESYVLVLVHALQFYEESTKEGYVKFESNLISKYRLMVSSVLLTTLPPYFPDILRLYFNKNMEKLSTTFAGDAGDADDGCRSLDTNEADTDGICRTPTSQNRSLVKNIGNVVRDLRSLGFTSMTEDAYASAIFLLLKTKVHDLAGDDYRSPVLGSIKDWIQLISSWHCIRAKYFQLSWVNDIS